MKRKVLLLMGLILLIVSLIAGCATPAPSPAPKTTAPTTAPAPSPSPTATPTSTPKPAPTATTAPAPAIKKITLTASAHTVASHPLTQELKYFADRVRERTGGQVEIKIFDSGSLVGGRDVLNAVRTGVVDIGMLTLSYWPSDFPFSGDIGFLPFASPKGWDSIQDVLNLSRPIVAKELEKQNMRVLFPAATNTEWFLAQKRDPGNPDWKGLKIMGTGAIAKTVEKYGGTPVAITSTELPVAVSTGVVHGAGGITLSSWDVLDLYDKLPYAYITGGFYNMAVLFSINTDTWKKLQPEVQKILGEEEKGALDFVIKQFIAVDNEVIQKAKARPKSEVIVLTQEQRKMWRDKLADLWDGVATKNGADGKAFIDALRKLGG